MQYPESEPNDPISEQMNQNVQQIVKNGCDSIDKVTFIKERNEKAENLFKDALKIDPNNKRAIYGLGLAQALLKKWDSALINFDRVLVGNPEFVHQPVEIVRKDREYVAALRGKSYCLINIEDFHAAIDFIDQYIEIRPEDSRGWFYKGFSLFTLGKYEESNQYFQKYLEIIPRDSEKRIDVLSYLGFIAYNLNDLEKAEKFFGQAYSENPLTFGAQISKKLVQEKRLYFKQQQDLIETAKRYLTCLLKDFRTGLQIVQYMFIIQFFAGFGLLLYALFLFAIGKNEILTYIAGASGGLIAVLSLFFSAPGNLQKNRTDFSQWMIAYFNWINTLYAVSGAINQISKNREVKWAEIEPLQDYLTKTTSSTIKNIEEFCEFPKKQDLPISTLNIPATENEDIKKSTEIPAKAKKNNPLRTHKQQSLKNIQRLRNSNRRIIQRITRKKREKSKTARTNQIITQIQKLEELHESGVLTDDEFTTIKKKTIEG